MKKTFAVILMVLILVAAVMLTACQTGNIEDISDGGSITDDGGEDGNGDDGDDGDKEEEKDYFPEVLDVLVSSGDVSLYNAINVADSAFYGVTLYFEFGDDVAYELTVKGNFDSTSADDNCCLIELCDVHNKDVLLSLYTLNGIVYAGESLSKSPDGTNLNWVKLSQGSSLPFIEDFFMLVPEFVADNTESWATGKFLSTELSSYLSLLKVSSALFKCEVPAGFDAENDKIDGDYKVTIDVKGLAKLLDVKMIRNLLKGVDDKLLGVINSVTGYVLGVELLRENGELSVVTAETVPTLTINATVADGVLSAIGVDYYKAEDNIDVRFGVKNFVAKASAEAVDVIPDYSPEQADIKDAAIKVSLDVFAELKEIDLDVDTYLIPDIALVYEDNEVSYSFKDVKAYAVASYKGKQQKLEASYDIDTGVFAFDLAGLYELLGMEIPQKTIYYIEGPDVNKLLGGFDGGGAQNLSADNRLDGVLDEIADIIDSGVFDPASFMAGYGDDILDIVLKTGAMLGGVCDFGASSLTISVDELMRDVREMKLDGDDEPLFAYSEWLKFGGKYLAEYLADGESAVSGICEVVTYLTGNDFDEGDLAWVLNTYAGTSLSAEETGEFLENLLIVANFYVFDDVGFGLSIVDGEGHILLSVKNTYALVGVDFDGDLSECYQKVDIENGTDLTTSAGFDTFIDEMQRVLQSYEDR